MELADEQGAMPECVAEFRWDNKVVEINYKNWVLTSKGFYYWENLPKNVLTLINELFKKEALDKIEAELTNKDEGASY